MFGEQIRTIERVLDNLEEGRLFRAAASLADRHASDAMGSISGGKSGQLRRGWTKGHAAAMAAVRHASSSHLRAQKFYQGKDAKKAAYHDTQVRKHAYSFNQLDQHQTRTAEDPKA